MVFSRLRGASGGRQLLRISFLASPSSPQQNFTSIYTKKMSKIFWKRKNIEILSEFLVIFWDYWFFWQLSWFSWISFDFSKEMFEISWKSSKNRKSKKIAKHFRKVSLYFFVFKKIRWFFIDRCKILLRSECAYLEGPNN